jgi:hypothetical protein
VHEPQTPFLVHSSTPPRLAAKPADRADMARRHVCPLCELSREAEHATVLDPLCPSCGGVLELCETPIASRSATSFPLARLRRSRTAHWVLTLVFSLPVVGAAGKIAWAWAGPGAGMGAVAIAALAAYVAVAPATRHC